jgi:(E)-4-hydroxy-3-methylbut-2-enyl-diphosphate synthase
VALEQAGCQILRVAIPDADSVGLIQKIKNRIKIPLVADIHFDPKLAIESAMAGADKIRLNPGNIQDEQKIKQILRVCNSKKIPVRIGVNSGSIPKDILSEHGHPTPQALCQSAIRYIKMFEGFDFDNIVISLKSSCVETMIKSYELFAQMSDYALHVGVTEAGTEPLGLIKSSIGIGSLLLKGIGDTIRVSLTADPQKEVIAAKNILKALQIKTDGVQIISCPTCGRTKIDLIKLVGEAEHRLQNCKQNLKIAIMGCAVNGPGEAKEADIGVAFGQGFGVIFKKGKILKKVPQSDVLNELINEIN